MKPETRYAKSGNFNIAYQVVGTGPPDLVLVPGWVSHIEWLWEEPRCARFFRRLASFSRLILFDKRGTGLSDRVADDALPTLEERIDDLRAIMDAVGSERAALLGISEGGPMCALFAATYPERTSALVPYGSYAKWVRERDYPWAPTREEHERALEIFSQEWGRAIGLHRFAPSVADDERFRNWWAMFLRLGASPGAALALFRMNIDIDVRHLLPTIRVPTLILHRTGDQLIDVGGSRYMAEHIPDAKYVELEGVDHLPWVGEADSLVGEIQEFLTGMRQRYDIDRVLATIMFTDIVGSTEHAARLGDRGWKDLLEDYYTCVRRELIQFRGQEVDTAGDGFLATFDGPARAIRSACAIRHAVMSIGITIRAGLHTGECEMIGEKVGGIAVHLGARVAATAQPGEVLISNTVKDLVAGSGLRFTDRGVHTLKGIPGEWRLFAVEL
ncbi:MAG: alpha/beta fold hydrolase [Anaerolineales bacterium]|nr:alpha/beta fold hydrolase [Anaerolineales bacterium]